MSSGHATTKGGKQGACCQDFMLQEPSPPSSPPPPYLHSAYYGNNSYYVLANGCDQTSKQNGFDGFSNFPEMRQRRCLYALPSLHGILLLIVVHPNHPRLKAIYVRCQGLSPWFPVEEPQARFFFSYSSFSFGLLGEGVSHFGVFRGCSIVEQRPRYSKTTPVDSSGLPARGHPGHCSQRPPRATIPVADRQYISNGQRRFR